MKTTRFLSVFLCMALFVSLLTMPQAAALEDPDIKAKAALLVDSNTGSIVYAKNEHQELYPASLTKIMTALLTLEAVDSGKLSMDQSITVSASALAGLSDDGSSAGIKAGEILTVEQLLYCMLVVSANEACDVLAEAVSGSVSAFVDAMNAKAAALGCVNTHFVNPNGLHDSQHYTSAWDLYLITREALTHPNFLPICDTADVVIPATNLHEQRHLYTTNSLISAWRALGYIDKDAHGIKTGSTSDAGHCLVSSATRGSLSFLSVVLGADAVTLESGKTQVQSFSETSRLFDYGFDNFSYKTVLEKSEVLKEVSVSLSKIDHVTVHPAQDVEILLPKDLTAADLERTLVIQDPVEAPVTEGQVLGSVELSHGGTIYATVDLLALNDVDASRMLTLWHGVQLFFAKTAVRVIALILAVLLLALLGWKLVFGRRRYRYGSSVGRSSRRGYHGRRR